VDVGDRSDWCDELFVIAGREVVTPCGDLVAADLERAHAPRAVGLPVDGDAVDPLGQHDVARYREVHDLDVALRHDVEEAFDALTDFLDARPGGVSDGGHEGCVFGEVGRHLIDVEAGLCFQMCSYDFFGRHGASSWRPAFIRRTPTKVSHASYRTVTRAGRVGTEFCVNVRAVDGTLCRCKPRWRSKVVGRV